MNTRTRCLSLVMVFIFVLMVASVVVYIAVYTSPNLKDFAHPDAKNWYAGLFIRLTYTMVGLYLMATGARLWAFVLHYRSAPPLGVRWLIELLYLYILMLLLFFYLR